MFTFRPWIITSEFDQTFWKDEFDHTNLQSDLHINIFIIRYQQPSQDLYAKFALLWKLADYEEDRLVQVTDKLHSRPSKHLFWMSYSQFLIIMANIRSLIKDKLVGVWLLEAYNKSYSIQTCRLRGCLAH